MWMMLYKYVYSVACCFDTNKISIEMYYCKYRSSNTDEVGTVCVGYSPTMGYSAHRTGKVCLRI